MGRLGQRLSRSVASCSRSRGWERSTSDSRTERQTVTLARSLRLLAALPFVGIATSCMMTDQLQGALNTGSVKTAKENVSTGIPHAMVWCWISSPSLVDPQGVTRWDVDSALLARRGGCQEAVDAATAISCEVPDGGGEMHCSALTDVGAPPPVVTDTVVDAPGLLQ